jgi:hypothetical protein
VNVNCNIKPPHIGDVFGGVFLLVRPAIHVISIPEIALDTSLLTHCGSLQPAVTNVDMYSTNYGIWPML